MPEPDVGMGALDDARNVSDGGADESAKIDHAHHGLQCRERIGGDFGGRIGNGPEQGALAGVGESHQADIGNLAELDEEPSFFAGFRGTAFDGSPIGGGSEMLVPETTGSAATEDEFFSRLSQVGDHLGSDLFHLILVVFIILFVEFIAFEDVVGIGVLDLFEKRGL